MKIYRKFISLVLVLILLTGASIPAFAAHLPQSEVYFNGITKSTSTDYWNFTYGNTTSGCSIISGMKVTDKDAYFEIKLDANNLTLNKAGTVKVLVTENGKNVTRYSKNIDTTKTSQSFVTWILLKKNVLTSFKIYVPDHTLATYKLTVSPHTHTYIETVTKKANLTADGTLNRKCNLCPSYVNNIPIKKIQNVSLNNNSYTYNGESKTPTFSVKDSLSRTILPKYYTITYSNNKNPGVGTAKITFNGKYYSGSKSANFTIKPKGTSLGTLTSKLKGFSVAWNKNSTQTTGYQLQYCPNSKFDKKTKNIIIKNTSTTYKVFDNLGSKKKFFVRVRTFKTSNKKTYYSAWSSVKNIVTGNADFVIIKQNTYPNNIIPYACNGNGKKIGSSGCGCCSSLMIIRNMTNSKTDLCTLAKAFTTQRVYVNGKSTAIRDSSGTNIRAAAVYIEQHYGLHHKQVTTMAEAKKYLEKGCMIIANVGTKNAIFSGGGGHFIVVAGIVGNNVIILDPNSSSSRYNSAKLKKYGMTYKNDIVTAPISVLQKDLKGPGYYMVFYH